MSVSLETPDLMGSSSPGTAGDIIQQAKALQKELKTEASVVTAPPACYVNIVPTEIQKRREQNRAAQRAFRIRKEQVMERLKEKYAELASEHKNLQTLYKQLLEKTDILESQIRELTGELENSKNKIELVDD